MTTRSDEALTSAGGTGQVRRFVVHFALVLCLASAAAGAVGGPPAALSGALGVLLAGANLWLMRRIMAALAGAGGGSAAWAIALPFKLLGLMAAALALVELGIAQPIPLAIGFALLPLTGVFLPRASSVSRPLDSPCPARPGQALK